MDVAIPSIQPDLAVLQALEQTGQFAELELQARQQIANFGQQPALVYWLGLALLYLNRNIEALPCLELVCRAFPDDANLWNQCAVVQKRLGRFEDAHTSYLKALALAPDNPELLSNIGDNLNDAGRYADALPWLEQAVSIAPQSGSARQNLANALIGTRRIEEARKLLSEVIAEGNSSPEILHNYSLLLREAGETEQAMTMLRQALAMRPDYPDALVSLGKALLDTGQFAEAEAYLERALSLEPDKPDAWAALAALRRMTPQDTEWLKNAESILIANPPIRYEIALRYEMGKYCDDVGDYINAFVHYRRANQLQKTGQPPFDRAGHSATIDYLIRIHPHEVIRQNRLGASDSMRPVFIVGMPRSGTSLTEQIIATHPATFGAGELYFWGRQADMHREAVLCADYNSSMLTQISEACLQHLHSHSSEALRVVDKMPENFKLLGLIHAVFPNARILHTIRHPIDTCLSIYFQNFISGHDYANELEDLAYYYCEYHRLMAHWRSVLPPGVFLDVPYEALVEDQEGWSRKIIDFMGLEWNDCCLEFHKTERKVGTASNWQVRQPVYKTSMERWRNYEQIIGPLLPLLELYKAV